MRRRILILLAATVLAALSVAAVAAYAHSADRRALHGREGRWVLLATATIPDGTTGAQIRARRLVRQVLMPAATVPSGAVSQLDATFDALALNAPLHPDQMVLRRQFEPAPPPGPSPTPTFALPPDRVAVSVELGIAPQVAGNVRPGDKVAVFLTYPQEDTKDRPQYTVTLLPSATVVSVGESATPTAAPSPSATASAALLSSPLGEDGAPLLRYVVTLAVTAADGQRLVWGYNTGHLHLGLLGAKASVSPSTTVSGAVAS